MLSSQLEEAMIFQEELESGDMLKDEIHGIEEEDTNIIRMEAENEDYITGRKYRKKIEEQQRHIEQLEKNLQHTRRTCCRLRRELNQEKKKKKIEQGDLEVIKAIFKKYF